MKTQPQKSYLRAKKQEVLRRHAIDVGMLPKSKEESSDARNAGWNMTGI
jgi:hypothetical protein